MLAVQGMGPLGTWLVEEVLHNSGNLSQPWYQSHTDHVGETRTRSGTTPSTSQSVEVRWVNKAKQRCWIPLDLLKPLAQGVALLSQER